MSRTDSSLSRFAEGHATHADLQQGAPRGYSCCCGECSDRGCRQVISTADVHGGIKTPDGSIDDSAVVIVYMVCAMLGFFGGLATCWLADTLSVFWSR